MEEELTQKEIDERIAIIKKFRSLLEQQRAKFNEYLHVLESQERNITNGNGEALVVQTELENQIVSNIASLQKVIVPFEALYRSSGAASYSPSQAKPVSSVQKDLEQLKQQVLEQNTKNQTLLKSNMSQIRQQIGQLRNPYKYSRSIYAEKVPSGSIMNIEA